MKKRNIFLSLLSILVLLAVLTYGTFYMLFKANNIHVIGDEDEYIYIYENSDYEDVKKLINEKASIKYAYTFDWVAKLLKYDEKKAVRSGRYKIEKAMSNLELIRNLRNGNQVPVMLTFNNIRTKEQLAGRLAQQLMPDSVEIVALMRDTAFQAELGLDTLNAVSLFLPDSYEVFWNIRAEKIFERMKREYDKFWTEERKQKAAAIPLTQKEVSILASIVDGETNNVAEKPIVAGLYLNRLRIGMPLQADPTVIFAIGDFTIRRVLNKHLQTDSPYNTYKNRGLTPGPIRIPTISALDAVLNYDKNDYLYMCAKETFNGEHNFAATWAVHLQNARKYQQALNERGIKK